MLLLMHCALVFISECCWHHAHNVYLFVLWWFGAVRQKVGVLMFSSNNVCNARSGYDLNRQLSVVENLRPIWNLTKFKHEFIAQFTKKICVNMNSKIMRSKRWRTLYGGLTINALLVFPQNLMRDLKGLRVDETHWVQRRTTVVEV